MPNIEDVQNINPTKNPLPFDPVDGKEQKRAMEEQSKQAFQQDIQNIQKSARQLAEEEKVYLKSNRPRAIQIVTEGVSLSGLLDLKSKGPYQVISRETLNEAYTLQDLMEPDEFGHQQVEEITREEYQEGMKSWRRTLKEKVAKLPTPQDSQAEDSENDIDFNYDIGRAMSPFGRH